MFTLPESLTELSADELGNLVTEARAHANKVITETPNDIDALTAARDAFAALRAEQDRRAQASTLAAELAATVAEPETTETEEAAPAPAEEPAVVTATVATVRRSTLDEPAPGAPAGGATMYTAPDVPNMPGGQPLTSFGQAVEAVTNRLRSYVKIAPKGRAPEAPATPAGTGGMFSLDVSGRSYVRHGAVRLQRNFPEELRITTGSEAEVERVKAFASKERRLPGGSLRASAQAQMKAGKALTAAIGWCAPSESIYNLCDLSSMDGLLDLPEIEAARGGFNVPANGGPDFSVVWDGIGNAGDVILTEYDIINGSLKECFQIPCPDFEDVRLDAAYLCLTGSLLQRRTYPEVVELFTQEAIKALGHKVNASVIARIVAASGAATVIPADGAGDDAASGILSAVDLAVEDIKYSQRMSRDVTLEVVLPYWALTQMRAALARRYGIGRLDVTDQAVFDWFAVRSAMPRFVYDWQDSYTGLNTGPGGASPLTALPTTVQFLIYPAGTWTKIVQPVVNLDTIYDNALLTSNEYTAVFVEDGFNVIQTCPVSRLYTAIADPSGVVGCCA
jgi:hypothetical protein